jgi:hypothetical protein
MTSPIRSIKGNNPLKNKNSLPQFIQARFYTVPKEDEKQFATFPVMKDAVITGVSLNFLSATLEVDPFTVEREMTDYVLKSVFETGWGTPANALNNMPPNLYCTAATVSIIMRKAFYALHSAFKNDCSWVFPQPRPESPFEQPVKLFGKAIYTLPYVSETRIFLISNKYAYRTMISDSFEGYTVIENGLPKHFAKWRANGTLLRPEAVVCIDTENEEMTWKLYRDVTAPTMTYD